MLLLLGWTMIWREKWWSPLEEKNIFRCAKVKRLYLTCRGWLLGELWSRFQHIAKTVAPSHFFSLEGKNLQGRMVHSLGADTTRA